MDIKEALRILEFGDVDKVPRLTDIQKQFRRLSLLKHPDKNPDRIAEATEEFQELLDAYQVAGDAASETNLEEEDGEEVIARKVFQQFQLNSVKVNSSSVTIKTEKKLNSIWIDVLTCNLGSFIDKDTNGKKFTMNDTCSDSSGKVFLTLYHTGNLLVQAEGNNQSGNIHFLNFHLMDFFKQVYNRKMLQSIQASKSKTPLRKLTRPSKSVLKRYNCQKCDFQSATVSMLAKHMKTIHNEPKVPKQIFQISEETSETLPQQLEPIPADMAKTSPLKSLPLVHHCMLCRKGFPDEAQLNDHERNVHEVKCGICNSIFYTDFDLNMHFGAVHFVHKVPLPPVVPEVSASQPDIDPENLLDKPLQQPTKSPSQKTASTDRLHDSVTELCNDGVPFPDVVAETPAPSATVEKPVEKQEVNKVKVPSYPCKPCGIVFGLKNALSDHIVSVHKASPGHGSGKTSVPTLLFNLKRCDLCDVTAITEGALQNHILSTHNPIPPVRSLPAISVKCNLCNFAANTEIGLQDHIKSVHNAKFVQNSQPPVSASTATLIQCDKCDFTAGTEFAFQLHIQSDHIPPSVTHPFPCSNCGKVFGDIKELKSHARKCHPNESHTETSDQDLKHYLKYIIEQNQEMFEDFCQFKHTVGKHISEIVSAQEDIKADFKLSLRRS